MIILGRRMASNLEKDNDLVSTSKHDGGVSAAFGGTAYEVIQKDLNYSLCFLPLKIFSLMTIMRVFGGGGLTPETPPNLQQSGAADYY